MHEGICFGEEMLQLPSFKILDVKHDPEEMILTVETTSTVTGCTACGTRAKPHERRAVSIRDLSWFGRATRLVWVKRRWRCPDADCETKTWTESHVGIEPRVVLSTRAAMESCRQVGELARPVAKVAEEFGVCWNTVMGAVEHHGTPLVEDQHRVGRVTKLGVDETSFLSATRHHRTIYATGLVDLDAKIVIDMVKGNSAKDLRNWTSAQDPKWLEGIEVVATDLAESFRAGLSPHLDHATRVADPFHVVRVANRMMDKVRRRVQNEQLGHRGRKADPLFRIRKVLLTGAERLDEPGQNRMLLGLRFGDPNDEVLGAWLAKESVREVYLTDDPAIAELLLDKAISSCQADSVPEIRSMAKTLQRWRTEILNHHRTGASNGPTEGLNLCVKRVKRCGHGFSNFENYRLRVLLHAGGVTWPKRPRPPKIRTREPYSDA